MLQHTLNMKQDSKTDVGAPTLSVIVPLGPRYEDLGDLCEELRRILRPLVERYEVIFVDDATGPHTRQILRMLSDRFPEARVIRLQRRMGESTALAIGAQSARGEILLTVDPYLHVSLADLPKILAPLSDVVDLVCAWRHPRTEGGLGAVASKAFNVVASRLARVEVHDLNCRVRAMRREILQEVPLYGDLYRFLPIFAARRGYSWCEVKVPQQPGKREMGTFSPQAYVGRFLDLLTLVFLTRFVKRPLHFFGLVGLTSLGIGLGIAAYLSALKLALGVGIGHKPLLLLAVLLIVVGIQIASIGLLGELMIFTHARDLKDYVIQEER
ncbi:MAG: glycosyltransferase [Candidatus Omnitrophica bacterium]|nr:glycosyltransferase [Candidatus Omnitrophota bacterium]